MQNGLSLGDRQVIRFGLERVKACLGFLSNPHEKFKSVLITGTNGKGSVTYYLSNLCCKYSDYKVGRYISPHLILWDERFVINEKTVDSRLLEEVSKEVLSKIKEFERVSNEILTEFEIYTIIAFCLFAKEKVDIAFLEIGMGGRLDATNVVDSRNVLCSIITNVSLEHVDYLGNTLEKIAYEKAGIIKEKNYIVTAADKVSLKVIEEEAKNLNANLVFIANGKNSFYIDKNIEIALKAWEVISKQIKTNSNHADKKEFLKLLQFPGRFQFISEHNLLLDGAHNPQAAEELRKLLSEKFNDKKIVYILGILDKDYESFINNLIPQGSHVVCTEPKSNRATKKEILARIIMNSGSHATLADNLQDAICKAKKIKCDLIVITGSLYLVGEALQLFSVESENVIPTKVGIQ